MLQLVRKMWGRRVYSSNCQHNFRIIKKLRESEENCSILRMENGFFKYVCFDEDAFKQFYKCANSGVYNYGFQCGFYQKINTSPNYLCDESEHCSSGSNLPSCNVTYMTGNACDHYKLKWSQNKTISLPLLNNTRCSVFDKERYARVTPYCSNYLDQTNCADIGGYCRVNGYMSSVSKYMLCYEYDEGIQKSINLCDNNFQNKCFFPAI